MIPPRKLAELPLSQKLRKATKIFEAAEEKHITSKDLRLAEAEYLGRITEILAVSIAERDAQAVLKKAGGVFLSMTENSGGGETAKITGPEIRRAINAVYHLLAAKTGHYRSDWDFLEENGGLDPFKRRPFPGMQVYLEDIRSPFNVGSMFRTAESFGAEKIWLSPFCADPKHKRAERSAMGCVEILPWERLKEDFLKDAENSPVSGIPLFALETGGIPLHDFPFPKTGILIAGSEELGVSPETLAAADSSLGRVSIPTRGAKGSLNVSVAFGIVMQAWASSL